VYVNLQTFCVNFDLLLHCQFNMSLLLLLLFVCCCVCITMRSVEHCMENQHRTTTRKKTVKSWEEKNDAMEGFGCELKKKERPTVNAPDHVQCGMQHYCLWCVNGCFLVANNDEAKERVGEDPTQTSKREHKPHWVPEQHQHAL
jgi:hypothetical protein